MCMYRCAYMCMEARGQLCMSSSNILYLYYLKQGLLLYLARLSLAGLHVTGILLLLAPQCWDYRHILYTWPCNVGAGHSDSSSHACVTSM